MTIKLKSNVQVGPVNILPKFDTAISVHELKPKHTFGEYTDVNDNGFTFLKNLFCG